MPAVPTHRQAQPRTLVVGGNLGRWSADHHPHDAAHVSGIEAWVYATDGHYVDHTQLCERDFRENDLIILNTNHIDDAAHLQKLLRLCTTRPSSTKVVCLLEGDMRDYLKPREHLRELLNSSDLVNCINHHATAALRLITTTPVEYIGIPYPVDGVRAFRVSKSERAKRVHLCPFLLTRWTEYHIAKEIGLPSSGYERVLTRRLRSVKENFRKHGSLLNKRTLLERAARVYNDPHLQIHDECWFADYYQQSASAFFWLNLDDRYTWGRHVLDAASLAVPCISTRSTGHMEILFPDCTLETPFDVDKAVALGRRLIDDEAFYDHVVAKADLALDRYQPHAVRALLFQHLGYDA